MFWKRALDIYSLKTSLDGILKKKNMQSLETNMFPNGHKQPGELVTDYISKVISPREMDSRFSLTKSRQLESLKWFLRFPEAHQKSKDVGFNISNSYNFKSI